MKRGDAIPLIMSLLESRTSAAPQGVGKPVRRAEDARLIVGAGWGGERVAVVTADTPSAAQEAGERVAVAKERLPAVTATADAARPDAPIVWSETASNVCVDSDAGDAAAAEAAFARAAHV